VAGIRASGTWGSALSSAEFAAVRSVGFEPVGQVFGAAVYGVGRASEYRCPGSWVAPQEAVPPPSAAWGPEGGARKREAADQVSERGGPEAFELLVETMDQARHTAMERLTAECAGLGGDGVVGLRLTRGSFPLGGHEFTVIGTAVRARGAAVPARAATVRARGATGGAAGGRRAPFTCDLSGQDFAKLIMAGWVPAGLVLGIAMRARHDDRPTTRQTRRWSGNAEIAGWTDLVNESRRHARRRLEYDVQRLGAEGVVIAGMQLRVDQRDCPEQVGRHDHVVEATLIGTAVARFARPDPGSADAGVAGAGSAGAGVAVMPLDPQRRQAARIRI
jgi:uncharacterized protein YbjQ (UPF0145 family)